MATPFRNQTAALIFPTAKGLFLSLLLAVFGGCGGKPEGSASGAGPETTPPLKLAFVTNNASEFWKIAAAGVHQYERESNVQVDIKMPPNGRIEEQNEILENLASQGYAAIAVSAVAPNDQVPILNRVAAKTKLITFDSDAPKSNRLLYIGTNNYEAGKVLGAEIAKLLPHGGKIAIFVGSVSADNAAQRIRGIEEGIAGRNIQILDKREDGTDPAKARSNVEDIINAHHDLNMVVGIWSYNGPAIAAALEALAKQGKVLAAVFDEDEGTLDGIDHGAIALTVVQKPYKFGYLASQWMHELATRPVESMAKIPADKIIDTGVEVINRTNVAEFKQRLAQMKAAH